jgi:hypothetical protein
LVLAFRTEDAVAKEAAKRPQKIGKAEDVLEDELMGKERGDQRVQSHTISPKTSRECSARLFKVANAITTCALSSGQTRSNRKVVNITKILIRISSFHSQDLYIPPLSLYPPSCLILTAQSSNEELKIAIEAQVGSVPYISTAPTNPKL